MGRPAHEPTARVRGLVQGYAACGTPEADIARLVGIDPKTLRKHYRDELDLAHLQANAKVAQSLYATAIDKTAGIKHVTAAIFWLKTRAGFRETDRVEHTGKDGAAIQAAVEVTSAPDLSKLDQKGRDALRTVLEGLSSGSPADA